MPAKTKREVLKTAGAVTVAGGVRALVADRRTSGRGQ